MSDEEDPTSDEYITPEFHSGHLQIVELTPIEMGEGVDEEGYELGEGGELEGELGGDEEGIEMGEGGQLEDRGDEEGLEIGEGADLDQAEGYDMVEGGEMGEGGEVGVGVEMYEIGEEDAEDAESDMKYMQVLDPSGKELMQLDLSNFTLVRCGDDDEKFKLVANSELQQASEGPELQDLDADSATVTYVIASEGDSEVQEADMSKAYMVMEGEQHEPEQEDSYVMVEGQDGPIVFLQSELKPVSKRSKPSPVPEKAEVKKDPTTLELLQRAKVVNQAKKLLKAFKKPESGPRGRGRPRKYDFPEANELLNSPSFRLFLYSCKLCDFKCNATKELTAHKEKEHGNWAVKYRTQYRVGANNILTSRKDARQVQCPHCPYRGISKDELDHHIQLRHAKPLVVEVQIDYPPVVKQEVVEPPTKEFIKSKKRKPTTDSDDDDIKKIFILENADDIYACDKN